MPRRAADNERMRQVARARLLVAAQELFLAQGYYATSIDDVARAAGTSKGLVYHYFASKEDLLAALVDQRIDDVRAVMRAAVAQEDPITGIRSIIEGALEHVQRRPDLFRFYLHLSTQPQHDPVVSTQASRLNQAYAEQFEVQTTLFERAGIAHPRDRSLYFSSTLQGIMLLYATYPMGYPLEAIKAQAITEFCLDARQHDR